MGEASSDSTVSLNTEKTVTDVLWLGTFYFNVPLNNSPNSSSLRKSEKPPYIDFCLEFEFERLSDLDLRITCTRVPVRDSIPDGDYTIEFFCDIFDEDSTMFEMKSGETVAGVDFSLKPGGQDLPSSELEEEYYYIKILVKITEYDIVSTKNHILQRELFVEDNKQIFSNESVLKNMCEILNVHRLEDIFTGRQNLEYIVERKHFIERAADYSKEIATYLKCKKESTTPPSTDLDVILNYLLHGESGVLSDSDLVKLYIKGQYLGLNFMVELIKDSLMDRLDEYVTSSLAEYEEYVIEVMEAAVSVNDEDLFHNASARLYLSKPVYNSSGLWQRFENYSSTSKFVIHFARQILEKIPPETSDGNGEEASSSLSSFSDTEFDSNSKKGEASSSKDV